MITADELVAAAAGLGLHAPEVDGSGGDFLVLHVRAADGVRWVLRAPRRESALEEMWIEGRVLDVIGDRLPVAIPEWTLRTADFVGYRRLPGEPAAVKNPAGGYTWHHDVAEDFPDQLGRFLAALHAIPIGEFADTGVEFRSPDQVRETIDRALHRAREVLGIPPVLWARWREWMADDDAWPPHSVLVHADVHPGHTLVSPDGRLVGVLDWTDIVVGDPAADFRRLAAAFGADGLDRVLDAYERHGGPDWPGMRRHIAERAAMSPVNSGLYGVDSGQERYVVAAREQFTRFAENPAP